MLKRIIIGLLSLSGVAICATEAQAGWVCLCNGGKACCVYRSGSIMGTQNACGVHPGDFLGLTAGPPPGSNFIDFVVFCRNQGQTAAPGVQAVGQATASNFGVIGAENINKNGCVSNLTTHVLFTDNQNILEQTERVCDEELNPNWEVAALVGCHLTITAQVLDENSEEVVNRIFNCSLPVTQCDPNAAITLGWDKKANAPKQVTYVDAITGLSCGKY